MNYLNYFRDNGLLNKEDNVFHHIRKNSDAGDVDPSKNTIIFKGDDYEESCIMLIASLEFLRRCGIDVENTNVFYNGTNYYINKQIDLATIHYMIAMQVTLEILMDQMAGSNISYLRDGLLFCQGDI